MLPLGGFSILVHLLVIMILKRNWLMIFSSAFMAGILVYTSGLIIPPKVILGLNQAINPAPVCQQVVGEPEFENRIVFRVDDVQAFTWRTVTMKMVEDASLRDVPLVLGVIPSGLTEDQVTVNFLRDNRCDLEIAMHGYDHQNQPPEFSDLSFSEAEKRLLGGKEILSYLSGEEVVTFIPPHNRYSRGTEEALSSTGFKVLSAEGDNTYDYTASTYDSNKSALIPVETVVSRCQADLEKDGLCVVMLHPQDYATNLEFDPEKYQHYLSLLDQLQTLEASFVRFNDII